MDAVNHDLTTLCLPILMSIPPISIYDVSDSVVLWHTFATDFLAAVPLLIKGIELSIHEKMYKRSNVYSSTTDCHGSRHGVFQTWYVGCHNTNIKSGALIVSIAVWVIAASCFIEFLFWRRIRVRKRIDAEQKEALLPNNGRYSDDLPVSMNVNADQVTI